MLQMIFKDMYVWKSIVTLDVSVYNHVAVQVRHALQDLSGVLARHVLSQGAVRFQLVFDRTLKEEKHTWIEVEVWLSDGIVLLMTARV